MPALEVADLQQWCLVWDKTGYDLFGQPVVGTPRQIRCRWTWVRREAVDAQGNTVRLDAQVAVAEDIPIGSWLWLGTSAVWNEVFYNTGSGSSAIDQELCEVMLSNWTPDIKGRIIRRTLGLMRLHSSHTGGPD